MTAALKLTKARREALEVLDQGPARCSNVTTRFDVGVSGLAGTLYWQSVDWLLAEGFAAPTTLPPHGEVFVITEAGRDLLKAVA